MADSRNTPKKIWPPTSVASTSTGTSNVAAFGESVNRVALLVSNPSTKAFAGTLQGSMGSSTSWITLKTFTTAGTTGGIMINTTGVYLIDKARIVLSGNDTTGTILKVWAGGY